MREKLLAKVEKVRAQLYKAEKECEAWNSGKYKYGSNAEVCKVLVKSLRKELSDLEIELSLL